MFKLTTGIGRSALTAFKPIRLLHTPRFYFADAGQFYSDDAEEQDALPRRRPIPEFFLREPPPLKDIIESEIKYEKANPPEKTQLLEILERQNWTLNSKGRFHELTKTVDDKTVSITFLSRTVPLNQPQEDEELTQYLEQEKQEEQNQQQEQEQEQEQEEQHQYYEQDNPHDSLEFTVYVRKGNNPQAIYADFIASNLKALYADFQSSDHAEMRARSINFTQNYETHKTLRKIERPQNIYQGPDLDTLNQNLVEDLTNYFWNLGLNKELIIFIHQYSLNSGRPFYLKWLQQLNEYVE